MLLGDVWAVTALIVGIAICAWALLLCLALVFEARTVYAKRLIEEKPGRMILNGLLVTLLVGSIGAVLLNLPNGIVKFVGWMVVLGLMALSFTGSAGLVSLAGQRVKALDPNLSAYAALSRGALFVVIPSAFPVLGWFLFAPIVFCLGVGAGVKAIRMRETQTVPDVIQM